jgi:hypothetical protein
MERRGRMGFINLRFPQLRQRILCGAPDVFNFMNNLPAARAPGKATPGRSFRPGEVYAALLEAGRLRMAAAESHTALSVICVNTSWALRGPVIAHFPSLPNPPGVRVN